MYYISKGMYKPQYLREFCHSFVVLLSIKIDPDIASPSIRLQVSSILEMIDVVPLLYVSPVILNVETLQAQLINNLRGKQRHRMAVCIFVITVKATDRTLAVSATQNDRDQWRV